MSQAEFCRRRRVKAVTFPWWKRRLNGAAQRAGGRAGGDARPRHKRKRVDFVEVALTKTGFPVDPRGYEMALGNGRVIRPPHDFDPAVVGRLVTAVESC